MGIENRNESAEHPEQVEQFREQESHKGEEFKKEFEPSSDFDEVKSEKAEFSDIAEKQEKKEAAEKDEDMSDPDKHYDESKEIAYDEAKSETVAETVDSSGVPSNEADIPEQKFETPENASSDYSSTNELKDNESDSKESNCGNEINTDRTTLETTEDGETNVKEREPSEAEADSNENKDANDEKNKSDEIVSEESNPERTSKWYDSQPPGQIESHHGLESIAKEYAGKEPLSEKDKKDLSDKQYDYLKSRNKEDRDDCRVYTADAIVSVDKNGEIKLAYPDNTDGAKEGSREMSIIKAGSAIDRIGPPNGKYVSPLNESGKAYSEKERGLPDRVEHPIENNSCYHRYDVKQDLTKENISAAIDDTYGKDTKEGKRMHLELDKYYQDCGDTMSPDHKGDIYSKEQFSKIDGVKTGEAAPMSEFKAEGGAKQNILPFSVEKMCNMGLIEESNVNK